MKLPFVIRSSNARQSILSLDNRMLLCITASECNNENPVWKILHSRQPIGIEIFLLASGNETFSTYFKFEKHIKNKVVILSSISGRDLTPLS